MKESYVIRSKKSESLSLRQNLSLGQTFLAVQFFSLHRYFIETTTIDRDMILQVLLQFCNNSGFSAMFDVSAMFDDVIMLSNPSYCCILALIG